MGEGVLAKEKWSTYCGNAYPQHPIYMRTDSSYYIIDILVLGLLLDLGLNWTFNQSSNSQDNVTYFKYFVPKSSVSKDPNGYFDIRRILKSIEKKKFISVALTNEDDEDQKRFSFIRFEARTLKYTNDTNTIVKVFIPDNCKYRAFLTLLYIVNEDQHKRYFEYQNWFYIFGEEPTKAGQTGREIYPIEL
jgi:hypothetical protein